MVTLSRPFLAGSLALLLVAAHLAGSARWSLYLLPCFAYGLAVGNRRAVLAGFLALLAYFGASFALLERAAEVSVLAALGGLVSLPSRPAILLLAALLFAGLGTLAVFSGRQLAAALARGRGARLSAPAG